MVYENIAREIAERIPTQHSSIAFTDTLRAEYAENDYSISHYSIPPTDETTDILSAMVYSDSADQRDLRTLQDSYGAFKTHIYRQFFLLKSSGVVFTAHHGDDEPYSNSSDMLSDLANKQLTYLPTSKTDSIDETHPFMVETDFTNDMGEMMNANDVFRCVHDAIAHSAGYGFSFSGEKGAWLTHRALLPRSAHLALWNETRGQNAWTNAGEHIRLRDGKGFYRLPQKGDREWVPMGERPFPRQKCVLAPHWII